MSPIDQYLAKLDGRQKTELERIRTIVHQTAPEAEEVISYGMPGFKYNRKYLVGFAAFKNHLSLFPTPGPIEAVKSKLGQYELSKGTIQFTTDKPIPEDTLKEIILHRLAEISKV